MNKIIVIGCGGHAKSVVDVLETKNEFEIVGFVDKKMDEKFSYRNYKIIGTDESLQELFYLGIECAVIGLGYLGKGKFLVEMYQKIKKIGFKLPVIIDKSANIASDVVIDEGTIVGKNVIINSAAKIGKTVILNSGSIIEHDCTIMDFSHVSVEMFLLIHIVLLVQMQQLSKM